MEDFITKKQCSECGGKRLKKESLFFKINNKSISELNSMSIKKFKNWMHNVSTYLNKEQSIIAKPIIKEIDQRIELLLNLGLDYLSLDRPLRTLSCGEAQRIRLATQIGTRLVGGLYILDEPSIGLHQRDNNKLIDSLKELRDLGNTIIVVEHDRDMMLNADNIIDLGPEAGLNGGNVTAQGNINDIIKKDNSITGNYLSGKKYITLPKKRRTAKNGRFLEILGATGNNLQKW